MHFVVKEAINSKIMVIKVLLVKYVKNAQIGRNVGQKMENLKIHLQCLRSPATITQSIHFTCLGLENVAYFFSPCHLTLLLESTVKMWWGPASPTPNIWLTLDNIKFN